MNSLQELTLQTGESVSGRVYCTDEMTGSIVLQKALVHTTLASEIRIVAAAQVTKSVALDEEGGDDAAAAAAALTPLTQPLPKIQKKALEERERRAIRLAEESLRHINQKVRCFLSGGCQRSKMLEKLLEMSVLLSSEKDRQCSNCCLPCGNSTFARRSKNAIRISEANRASG